MRYIKFHDGQFNFLTHGVRKGTTRDIWSEYTFIPCHIHSLGKMSTNALYYQSVNSLNVLSIKIRPHDVCGLHTFSVTDLKILSINDHPRYVREYMDVVSESGLTGMNGLGK